MALTHVKEDPQNCIVQEDGQDQIGIDTTEIFNEVFGSRRQYDSWDEFVTVMEEFQIKSRTAFKLRSCSRVDYINEKRVNDLIPDRFVYAKVKVICVHFGLPTVRGPGHRKNYVGKGCGAVINVGYSKGALRIINANLVHTNHGLCEEGDELHLRDFRMFNFDEELDLIMAKEVNRQNPFEVIHGEKQWAKALTDLKKIDSRFESLSLRVMKKRIRLLMERFLVITNGKKPVDEDELGNLLYNLEKTQRETLNDPSRRGRGHRRRRKRSHSSNIEDDDDDFGEDFGDYDDDDIDIKMDYSSDKGSVQETKEPSRRLSARRHKRPNYRNLERGKESMDEISLEDSNDDSSFEMPVKKRKTAPVTSTLKKKRGRPCKIKLPIAALPKGRRITKTPNNSSAHRESSPPTSPDKPSYPDRHMKFLVKYLHHRDKEERRLRQQEIDLRREELAVHKREVEIQRKRFDSDQMERKALLEYLRAQAQLFERQSCQTSTVTATTAPSAAEVVAYASTADVNHPQQEAQINTVSVDPMTVMSQMNTMAQQQGQTTEYTIVIDNK